MDDGFCASSGGECELVGHACCMEVTGIRLCQAPGASHLETSLRRRSPMTMPRTLPFGFWSATTLPSPMAWLTWCGMSALAKQVATATKCCEVTSSSRTSLRISAVNPEGPGAAPFLAFRRLVSSCVAGRLGGAGGWNSVRCCGNSWYGWGGRLAGSRSSWRVASVLGANGPAVRAWRAADISP